MSDSTLFVSKSIQAVQPVGAMHVHVQGPCTHISIDAPVCLQAVALTFFMPCSCLHVHGLVFTFMQDFMRKQQHEAAKREAAERELAAAAANKRQAALKALAARQKEVSEGQQQQQQQAQLPGKSSSSFSSSSSSGATRSQVQNMHWSNRNWQFLL